MLLSKTIFLFQIVFMLLNFFLNVLPCVWVLPYNPCQAELRWNKLGGFLLSLVSDLTGHSKLIFKLHALLFILNKTVFCLTGVL